MMISRCPASMRRRRPQLSVAAGSAAIAVAVALIGSPPHAAAQIVPPPPQAAPTPGDAPGIWVEPPRQGDQQPRRRPRRDSPSEDDRSDDFGCPAVERDLQLLV